MNIKDIVPYNGGIHFALKEPKTRGDLKFKRLPVDTEAFKDKPISVEFRELLNEHRISVKTAAKLIDSKKGILYGLMAARRGPDFPLHVLKKLKEALK